MSKQVVAVRRHRKGSIGFIVLLVIYFCMYRACSPPDVGTLSFEDAPRIPLNELLNSPDRYADLPAVITAEIQTSFYFSLIGGFYVINSLDSNSSTIVFTSQIPPEDGSVVEVFGTLRPIICNSHLDLLYFKEKDIELKATSQKQVSANSTL